MIDHRGNQVAAAVIPAESSAQEVTLGTYRKTNDLYFLHVADWCRYYSAYYSEVR